MRTVRRPIERSAIVRVLLVVLLCLDLRLDFALFSVPLEGGRTWSVLALFVVLLGVVVVSAVIRARRPTASSLEMLACRLRRAGPRPRLVVTAGLAALLADAYVAVSAVVLLPLVEAPGYSLGEIYAAVARLQGSAGLLADLLGPIVVCCFAAVLVAAVTVVLLALRVPWPWATAVFLAALTPLAIANFLLGFSFGTDVPDVLPPGVGISPPSDTWFVVVSQAGLLAAIWIYDALLPETRRSATAVPAV